MRSALRFSDVVGDDCCGCVMHLIRVVIYYSRE